MTFGPLAVRWFGLLALAGLGVAIWLSLRELDRQRLGRKLALDGLAWGLPAGIVCARLVHVLGYWDYYLTHASALWQLNIDGLSLWGGLAGGVLVAAARLRRDAYAAVRGGARRLWRAAGRAAGPPAAGRLARRAAGVLHAAARVRAVRGRARGHDLVALGLFGLLLALPRRLPAGTRFAAFLMMYGAARIGWGTLRLDPAFLFGLQIEQILAWGAIAAGTVYGLRPLVTLGTRQRVRSVAAVGVGGEEDSVAA